MEQMQPKYRIYRRGKGVFYWQENGTANRGSLRTKNRADAEELMRAKNEAQRQPALNLALGRYLAPHNPQMTGRTWQRVMDQRACDAAVRCDTARINRSGTSCSCQQ